MSSLKALIFVTASFFNNFFEITNRSVSDPVYTGCNPMDAGSCDVFVVATEGTGLLVGDADAT